VTGAVAVAIRQENAAVGHVVRTGGRVVPLGDPAAACWRPFNPPAAVDRGRRPVRRLSYPLARREPPGAAIAREAVFDGLSASPTDAARGQVVGLGSRSC
jgi:hypothetical protein